MNRRMLTKEDEAAGDEVEVRREDQDKINKFSRLHQRELNLEEELKSKNKEKEELDDITMELELADEDDKVPSECTNTHDSHDISNNPIGNETQLTNSSKCRYKIGDAFFHLPLLQAQELLVSSTTRVEEEVSALEDKLGTVKDEMTQLKVELYARFGRSINLET
ncbi:Prefoldin, subunit 4 [Hypoxylon trugodes]|uniref:Prefoldin, subunit 4 n=1 Tax=Hypoxylon trugodes TaxID=326681 RepID=UPI00219B8A69|nr:Prefoldin, subunit 4 [Hypoxylon trugodes]KAI1389123.1 Prefoldin, subunit 4 [Hypoxylon trugodes]